MIFEMKILHAGSFSMEHQSQPREVHAMKALFYALTLSLSISFANAQDITVLEVLATTKVVVVPISTPWTSTGIRVSPGETIDIVMTGIANTAGTDLRDIMKATGWVLKVATT